jgi:curved DNA-binding protein
MGTHYDTLGVSPQASGDEIKAAFRKLAREHHPDRGGDQAKFKQINEAYNNLRDAETRAQYDAQMRGGGNPFAGFHGQPGHGGNPFEFHFQMGGGDPFGGFPQDIFQQFGFNVRQPARNRNIRVEVELDFLSTLKAQSKVIQYGTSKGPETIQLDLPAGVEHQNVFTVQGRGDNANPSIPRGNLEVVIIVKPHDRFQRSGDHILEDITIDCFQAIMGMVKRLQTPTGKTIELNIPAGTQHGVQFAITDEGFYRPNGMTGKYIVRVSVLTPTALTREQLDLVAQIQKIRPINT